MYEQLLFLQTLYMICFIVCKQDVTLHNTWTQSIWICLVSAPFQDFTLPLSQLVIIILISYFLYQWEKLTYPGTLVCINHVANQSRCIYSVYLNIPQTMDIIQHNFDTMNQLLSQTFVELIVWREEYSQKTMFCAVYQIDGKQGIRGELPQRIT